MRQRITIISNSGITTLPHTHSTPTTHILQTLWVRELNQVTSITTRTAALPILSELLQATVHVKNKSIFCWKILCQTLAFYTEHQYERLSIPPHYYSLFSWTWQVNSCLLCLPLLFINLLHRQTLPPFFPQFMIVNGGCLGEGNGVIDVGWWVMALCQGNLNTHTSIPAARRLCWPSVRPSQEHRHSYHQTKLLRLQIFYLNCLPWIFI